MAAGRVILPCMPALDLNGRPVSGALLNFYENNTTTRKAVYTTADLTTPLSNPVVADGSGVFPSIFADEEELYSVTCFSPLGVMLPKASYSSVRATTAIGDGLVVVSSFMQTVLDDTSAAAARATLDVQKKFRVDVTEAPFNAVGDAATDDSAAIQAAIDYVQTNGGGTVFFPAKSFVCEGLTVTSDNVTLTGSGYPTEATGGTKLLAKTATSTILTVGVCAGNWIERIAFQTRSVASPACQTAGQFVRYNGSVITGMDQCVFKGGWDGVMLNGSSGQFFTALRFYDIANRAIPIQGVTTHDTYFKNIFMDNTSNLFAPVAAFDITGHGGSLIVTEVDLIHVHKAFYIHPGPGEFVIWSQFSNVYCDTLDFLDTPRGGIGVHIAPTGTGKVIELLFDRLWTATGERGLVIEGLVTTEIRNIAIGQWQCKNNLQEGLYAKYVDGLYIDTPMISGNSVTSAGTYSGVVLDTGATNVSIMNGEIGENQFGFATLQKYNIEFAAGFTGVINCTNVRMSRFGTASTGGTGAPATGSEFLQCSGVNLTGITTPTVTTPNYSLPVNRLIKRGFHLYGGTVSGVTIDGNTIATSTAGTVGGTLNPGQALAINATVAPTLVINAL
jgi:hypothetical protein